MTQGMRSLLTNTVMRYGRAAIAFHWTMAALILFMFWLGPYMANLPETDPWQFPLFQLHKSIGLSILVLGIARLSWRLINTVPELPTQMPEWQRVIARASHGGLYLFMLVVPVVGWASVSAAPLGIPTMWFGLFEWPALPYLGDLPRAQKQIVVGPLESVHAALAFILMGLVALHIAAALKHHFMNRDFVLRNILP